jgi:ELWxxDGT repeat protein
MTRLLLLTLLFALSASAQPVQVSDVRQAPVGSYPSEMTVLNGTLYFRADDGRGAELFAFDASAGAVRLAADLDPGGAGYPRSITRAGGALYFAAEGAQGDGVYRYEPGAGAVRVSSVAPWTALEAGGFADYEGALYFAGRGDQGFGLYAYSFSSSETRFVFSADSCCSRSAPKSLTVSGGALYFFSETQNGFTELYRFEVSSGQAERIDSFLSTHGMIAGPEGVYFLVDSPAGSGDLYHLSNSGELETVASNASTIGFGLLASYDERILFAGQSASGAELYAYDPASKTLSLAADVIPGAESSHPQFLAPIGGRLYFSGVDSEAAEDVALYAYDASAQTIKRIGKTHPGTPVEYAGQVYFAADGPTGVELYVHDPQAGGRALAAEIHTGNAGSLVEKLVAHRGELFFLASDDDGRGLFRYDPSSGTTRRAAAVNVPPFNSSVPTPVSIGNEVLYLDVDAAAGAELFAFDLDTDESRLVADIHPSSSSIPSEFAVLDGTLYFAATSEDAGRELFAYDPASGSVALAVDGRPGAGGGSPTGLTAFDGMIYHAATYDQMVGSELYRFDPQTGQVELTQDVGSGFSGSSPRSLTVHDGKLYFFRSNGEGGLYQWDPSTGAAQQIDLSLGQNRLDLSAGLISFGKRLFFSVQSDGLWAFDPAEGQARRVDAPDLDYQQVRDFTIYGDKLYFSATTRQHGTELFAFDQQAGVVALVADLMEDGSSDVGDLTVLDGALYFKADGGTSGAELWKYVDPTIVRAERIAIPDEPSVRVTALPNPAVLTVQIVVSVAQAAHVRVDLYNVTGQRVAQVLDDVLAPSRPADVQLDVSDLPAGAYFVRCILGDAVRTVSFFVAR